LIELLLSLSVIWSGVPKLVDYGIDNPHSVRVSWYDTGHVTANGESFDPNGLTYASHLPFNTVLVVEAEGRALRLRGNDTGPWATDSTGRVVYPLRSHPTRQLDLSRAAFTKLFRDRSIGVGYVRIICVEWEE
jgi:rare lipoprotein A (peptidoglycan hydrolase)